MNMYDLKKNEMKERKNESFAMGLSQPNACVSLKFINPKDISGLI